MPKKTASSKLKQLLEVGLVLGLFFMTFTLDTSLNTPTDLVVSEKVYVGYYLWLAEDFLPGATIKLHGHSKTPVTEWITIGGWKRGDYEDWMVL